MIKYILNEMILKLVISLMILFILLMSISTIILFDDIYGGELDKCRTQTMIIKQINITSQDCTIINIYVPKEQLPYIINYNYKFNDIKLKECDLFLFKENLKNDTVYIEYNYNQTRTISQPIIIIGEPICNLNSITLKTFKILQLI